MEKEVQTNTIEATIRNLGFADSHEFAKIQLTKWIKKYVEDNILMYSQEKQLFAILEKLSPEIRRGDYTNKPAMTEQQRIEIEQICSSFAVSFEQYVCQEFLFYCQEQLKNMKCLLQYYQRKYQMDTWEEASEKFHEFAFDMIEKEDDLWHWEEISDNIAYYQAFTK